MTGRASRPWIRSHDGSRGFWGFSCERCQQKQKMPNPVQIAVYLAAAKEFAKVHHGCKQPKQKP